MEKKEKKEKIHLLNTYKHLSSIISFIPYSQLMK